MLALADVCKGVKSLEEHALGCRPELKSYREQDYRAVSDSR